MKRYRYLTFILLLYFSPSIAWAEDTNLLVALHIQVNKIDLQYADTIRQTDIDSLDVIWHQTLNPWLDGIIKLGFLGITQDSNPVPEGQSTTGQYLGIGLRFHLYPGDYLKLFADLDYQYADAESTSTSQTVQMRWHQLSAQLQAEIKLFQYSYLTLSAGTLKIDGDEHASGTTTAVISFKNAKSEFGRLGFKIGVDPISHIGIEVVVGAMEGGRIYFQRWF